MICGVDRSERGRLSRGGRSYPEVYEARVPLHAPSTHLLHTLAHSRPPAPAFTVLHSRYDRQRGEAQLEI